MRKIWKFLVATWDAVAFSGMVITVILVLIVIGMTIYRVGHNNGLELGFESLDASKSSGDLQDENHELRSSVISLLSERDLAWRNLNRLRAGIDQFDALVASVECAVADAKASKERLAKMADRADDQNKYYAGSKLKTLLKPAPPSDLPPP